MKTSFRILMLCLVLIVSFGAQAWSVCGDLNGDGNVANILDLNYFVNYLYRGGPVPVVMADADIDGCPGVTVLDYSFMMRRIFQAGPPSCTGPVNCLPGTDNGLADGVKLVYTTPPVVGTNVPVVVACSVFVDADALSTIQFAWSWDNPDLQMVSATASTAFNAMGIGAFFFLDNNMTTTNTNRMAMASATTTGSTPYPSNASGWRHLATYNMTASSWTAGSSLTIDIDQDPAYASTELIFIPLGGQFYYPAWGGAIVSADTDGDGIFTPSDNCPDIANPLQEDWNNDGAGDACNLTTTGSNVVVQVSSAVTINFSQVISSGTTGIVQEGTGPIPPANFGVVPLNNPVYYQISTTAAFTPPIEICFTYNDADIQGNEADLTLMHYEGSVWVNIKSSQDLTNNVICGMTNSLSYFALMEGCCIGIRGDVNSDGGVNPNILDLNYLVNRIFRGGPVPRCLKEADVNGMGGIADVVDLNFLVNRIFRNGPNPGSCG